MTSVIVSQRPVKKSKLKIDLDFLDAPLLRSEVAIEDALSILDSYLENLTVNASYIVMFLTSRPHLFEFIASALNDSTFEPLKEWILAEFPLQAEHHASSLVSSLLDSLSLSLLFVPTLSADESAELKAYRHIVVHAKDVLSALSCGGKFDDADMRDNGADIPERLAKRKTQREKKLRKRQDTVIDPKPFEGLGLRIPSTLPEAEEMANKVLTQQKDILQYYFQLLRNPDLTDTFRSAYIPVEVPAYDATSNRVETEPPPVSDTAVETLPVAYPMVQPIKAALYFDNADGFGDWHVLISTRADADLRQARKREVKLFDIILKKIRELSRGHFSQDNHKVLTGPETDIPIFEAKMTRDSRLVYQIDCVPEFESHVERQVIRIFGIYTHAQLDRRFWEGVGYQLGRKGKEYRARCLFRNRPQVRGDKVFKPGSWPPTAESNDFAPSTGISDLHKNDLSQLHELLVLGKYVTFSQALLNGILADKDIQHVFNVSMQEMQIIEHPSSCYVIGRSGTGKTTTMMFKMLGIERSAQACGTTMPKVRQLFVTQSAVLAVKVEEFFMKLLGSLNMADLSPEELAQIDISARIRRDRGMVDHDEEIAHQEDTPKRFSDLTDNHFPMFITFNQLCSLLEADLDVSIPIEPPTKIGISSMDNILGNNRVMSTDYMHQSRPAFVSYAVFQESYWPSFPQSLKSGLDPTLLFGEFMGVIQGSEKSLRHQGGCLDKTTYINLSPRQQPTFSGIRDTVWQLFEKTHMILKKLRGGDLPGQQLDFIYIDEAQDNLLIDALILRMLCKNPNSGLFWAGDTAQTISIGSAFRFNDLKAFLYRIETSGYLHTAPRIQHPHSFQLAVNYRSHAGIVNCAHSIIELITHFWPNAIDRLTQEKGVIDGNKPIFFGGWDEDTPNNVIFRNIWDLAINIDIHPGILVRDDDARTRLRAQVGDIGIIFTLYESKGLEFDDVLLYNFFEDSDANISQWRVVLNALTEDIGVKSPRFDDIRHSSICRELKFLYVATTRARMNLWIADSSDKAEPMRLFWTAKGQINTYTPGMDVPRLAEKSSPEQWATTGHNLFENKRYFQAMHCYGRASLRREETIARAFWLREQARSFGTYAARDGMTQPKAFTDAAEAFWDLAEDASTEKQSYFRTSAKCYVSSGEYSKAAEAYYRACEFDLAAQQYRKIGMFDEAIAVVKLHRETMDEVVAKSIVDVSRLVYLRGRKLQKARDLFASDQEALQYMDDLGFNTTRATLLEQLGKYSAAAEIHLAEGRTLEAIQLFSRDKQNPQSMKRASRSLLDGMWRNISFGIDFNSDLLGSSDTLRGLLPLLGALDTTSLDDQTRDEKFHNHHHDDIAALMCLDRVFPNLPDLVAKQLQPFLLYARLLQKVIATLNLGASERMARLFAFKSATDEFFLVPSDTLLFACCHDYLRLSPDRRDNDRGTLIPRWVLFKVIHDFLCKRLWHRVREDANGICDSARGLPCLVFTVYGHHDNPECWREHTMPVFIDAKTYNLRVRILLQQILIYHTIYMLETRWAQTRYLRRYWLLQLYEALYPSFYKLGGIHNLSTGLIPELKEGLQVVGIWTRELLQAIKPYTYDDMQGLEVFSSMFLSILLRLTSLSLTFEPAFLAQRDHLRIHAISSHAPNELLRGKQGAYIVHDALACMENNRVHSVNSGVLFIRHILENRIPIDVGVLFDFLDRLCAMLVVASRNRNRFEGTTLDGITLPRSWLMRLARDFDNLGSRESNLIFLYVRPMADLLEQIYTGTHAEHLKFGASNFAEIGFSIRNIFVLRLCKNLSLLGYNVRNIRMEVLRCITSIRYKSGRNIDNFNRLYVDAKTWDELSWLVRKSVTGTSLDEMIEVREANKSSPHLCTSPNVRRIVYNVLDDLPALLGSADAPLSLSIPPSVTPAHVTITDTNSGSPAPAPEDGVEVLEQEVHANPEDFDAADVAEPSLDIEEIYLSTERPRRTSVKSTTEELQAARIILSAYRQYRRRGAFPTSLRHHMRTRLYTACYEASGDIEWSQKLLYKLLFLGSVPHLLVSLEGVHDYLDHAKAKATEHVKSVRHLELEKVYAEISRLSTLLKEAEQLQEDLGPKSELHKRQDVGRLRGHAQRVMDLVQALPPGAAMAWKEDLRLAMRGIVETKANAAAKKLKPELNVEDDLLDWDYEDV
ncbi:hypothetical protein B0H21DRAFT_877321 [Amylocystis lapponica]|nr:hypothetical protein B0H21DRAFT_877321 [Amylocystis lapponica]